MISDKVIIKLEKDNVTAIKEFITEHRIGLPDVRYIRSTTSYNNGTKKSVYDHYVDKDTGNMAYKYCIQNGFKRVENISEKADCE